MKGIHCRMTKLVIPQTICRDKPKFYLATIIYDQKPSRQSSHTISKTRLQVGRTACEVQKSALVLALYGKKHVHVKVNIIPYQLIYIQTDLQVLILIRIRNV